MTMQKRMLMLGCFVAFCSLSPVSQASTDEFVGTIAGHVLGFAMLSERFPTTSCARHIPNTPAMRIYRDTEAKILALLSPALKRELTALLASNPDFFSKAAERMLAQITPPPANSERETCVVTAAIITSLYHANQQVFEEYASMVGIK
jgi:hypothetical protein